LLIFTVNIPTKAFPFFDPATVSACIGLASSAISIFGTRVNPQAREIDTILTHVRAINQRLDKIEDGLISIMDQIEQLPSRWREDMKAMIDELRGENAVASALTIDEIFAGLKDADSRHNRQQRKELMERLRLSIPSFKNTANNLFLRSGSVSPVVIMSMIRDVWIERLIGMEDITISRRLAQYDEYFAEMQNDTVLNSVAYVRAGLEKQRKDQRARLLSELGSESDSKSVSGRYDFYMAALTETRQHTEQHTRQHVHCFGRGENGDCIDAEVPYIKTIPYEFTLKTVVHQIFLEEKPLDDHPDLGVITFSEKTAESVGAVGTPQGSEHSLDIVDRRYDPRRKNLAKSVEMLNLGDEAIALLRDQETAIALARALIASWDNDSANALAQRADMLAKRDVNSYRVAIADYKEGLIVQASRAGIVDARKLANESISAAEKSFSEALEQARKVSWQQDVGQILAVAQFGLQAYQTVTLVLTKFPARSDTSKPAPELKSVTSGKGDAKSSPKSLHVVLDRGDAARTYASAAQQLIEEAEKSPAELWKNGIPRERPVRSEAMLKQALIYLDLADKAAIAFSSTSGLPDKSDAEIYRETIQALRKGKLFDAFMSAIQPSSTSSQDMLGGLDHRNVLRGRALGELARFTQIRVEQERRRVK
jgi:hypothetical protein